MVAVERWWEEIVSQKINKRLDKLELQLSGAGRRAYGHCKDPRDWPTDALVDYLIWAHEQNPDYANRPEVIEARKILGAGDCWEAGDLLMQIGRPSREAL